MTIRVGYFPSNNSLWILRHRGILERTLPDVEWVDLRALPQGERPRVTDGLPTVHGDRLADRSYDVIGTGATPPITAQGQGHDIVYLATSGPRHENGRLVVLDDSPITDLSDLRGKRIGIGHGSWQTTLLLLALDRVELTWHDVEAVDLAGTDGAERLLAGELDAWVGAYPGLSGVEELARTRDLVATDGLFSHRSLWFTRREVAEQRQDELAAVVAALQESDAWVRANPREAAKLFVDDPGGDLDAWEHALRTRPFGLLPVTEEFVAEQQHAADLLYANGLLPRSVTVADAVLPAVGEIVRATTSVTV